MHDFNDLEGLRIAIEMEKRGEALYRKAARVSKKREVVDMLAALAADEVAHAAEFSPPLRRGACPARRARLLRRGSQRLLKRRGGGHRLPRRADGPARGGL